MHAAVRTGLSRRTEEKDEAVLDRPKDIETQAKSLKQASPEALRAYWRSYFRKPYPDHLPRHLLVALIAWHLQAEHQGGLSKEEERYFDGVANRPEEEPVPRFGDQEDRHRAGTVFVREHAGVHHRVVKTADGYEWQGRHFKSLSAAASAITGTNWNGPRFFGVNGPKRK